MKRRILTAVVFVMVTFLCWVFIATMALQVVTTREVPRWVPLVSLLFAVAIGGAAAHQVWKIKAPKNP